MQVDFHGDHRIVTKLRQIWPPSVLAILPDLRQRCLSVMAASLFNQPMLSCASVGLQVNSSVNDNIGDNV